MRWIDACHGIGGFRLGFEAAGAECVDAFDINAELVEHYRSHGWESRRADIFAFQKMEPADLLACGTPCQPFSLANSQREEDAENKKTASIPGQIFALARANKIPVVFLENVEGLLSASKRETFFNLLQQISESGYDAQWAVVDCSLLGAPTKRTHLLIIGVARDSRALRNLFPEKGLSPLFCEPEYGAVYPYRLTSPVGQRLGWGSQLFLDFEGKNLVRYRTIGTREFQAVQGFPEGWVDGLGYRAAFQALADSFPPAAAYTIAKALMETL